MPKRVSVRVRAGRRETVVVRPILPAPTEAGQQGRVMRRGASPLPLWGEIAARFVHLGAYLGVRSRPGTLDPVSDLENLWGAVSYESEPFPTVEEVIRVNGDLRARAEPPDEPVTYLYSDRPLEGQGYPLGAVDLVSGYNAALGLARARRDDDPDDAPRPDALYALQHNAPYVARLRTATERLADVDALREMFERSGQLADWKDVRDRVERMKLEKFEAFSARLAGADMTLRAAGLAPGLYAPRFSAGDQFYAWDTEAGSLYRTERRDPAGNAHVGPAWMATGRRTSTRLIARLVPRRHRILFSWTSIYAVATVFTSPVLVAEAAIGTYSDILPLDWAYVGAEDDPRNNTSISNWIAQSRRFALVKQQDEGSQIFSPYIVKVLVGRQDGQWAVREGDMAIGDLCAVLDIDRGGYSPDVEEDERTGARDRYEVTRLTYHEGGRRLNMGLLYIPGAVDPYDPSGQSIWAVSQPLYSL